MRGLEGSENVERASLVAAAMVLAASHAPCAAAQDASRSAPESPETGALPEMSSPRAPADVVFAGWPIAQLGLGAAMNWRSRDGTGFTVGLFLAPGGAA